jgi:HSP20 family protein
MNRLFNTFFDPTAAGNGEIMRSWIPAMDLVEEGNHLVLRADVPGIDEDDIKVELEDNVLTISGERGSDHEEHEEGYRRLERAFGRFSRSLALPEPIEPDRIEARLEQGVLELRIPKPEERKPQRVAINVGEGPAVIEGAEGGASAQGEADKQSAAA